MASATFDSPFDRPLQLDSIPTVDLHLLSQFELYTLSLCSDAAFDPLRCDDVIVPKIDRSVFNESAGSRKQTYSRLRLAPAASSTTMRRRTPHLRSHNPHPTIPIEIAPEIAEKSQIITLLKELFVAESNGQDFSPIRVEYSDSVPEFSNWRKRKRGRQRKDENAIHDVVFCENVEDRDREILNPNGLVVDMEALAGLEDPYGPELRRRTEGMVT